METIKREGQVIQIVRGKAKIRLEQEPACASCGSRSSCGTAEGKLVELALPSDVRAGARVGDFVSVSLPASTLTWAALLGYVVPPVGLLAGAIVASSIFAGDVAPSLGAAAGFFAGLLVARLIVRSALGQGFQPTVCQSGAPTTAFFESKTESQ
ncbi:SoxR reducing system RseC family protein [Propionivibrio limicola]|uniref:SoxR reducing system RseC family protein n=1 Tax=Propionivibrio limicola TaxID=167645 RepID=UPI001290AD49|nr:SoxR reducing system RseC family protein [Propionivibrio limicola]